MRTTSERTNYCFVFQRYTIFYLYVLYVLHIDFVYIETIPHLQMDVCEMKIRCFLLIDELLLIFFCIYICRDAKEKKNTKLIEIFSFAWLLFFLSSFIFSCFEANSIRNCWLLLNTGEIQGVWLGFFF